MDRRTTTAFAGAGALLDRGIRDQLRLGWRLLRDERVPALKLALPALLALYLVSSRGCFLLPESSRGWRPNMSSVNTCGR